jgi:hypothetical protein
MLGPTSPADDVEARLQRSADHEPGILRTRWDPNCYKAYAGPLGVCRIDFRVLLRLRSRSVSLAVLKGEGRTEGAYLAPWINLNADILVIADLSSSSPNLLVGRSPDTPWPAHGPVYVRDE